MGATFYHNSEIGSLKSLSCGVRSTFRDVLQRMSISITHIVYIRIYYHRFVTPVFWKCISGFHIWSLVNS